MKEPLLTCSTVGKQAKTMPDTTDETTINASCCELTLSQDLIKVGSAPLWRLTLFPVHNCATYNSCKWESLYIMAWVSAGIYPRGQGAGGKGIRGKGARGQSH